MSYTNDCVISSIHASVQSGRVLGQNLSRRRSHHRLPWLDVCVQLVVSVGSSPILVLVYERQPPGRLWIHSGNKNTRAIIRNVSRPTWSLNSRPPGADYERCIQSMTPRVRRVVAEEK